MRFPGGGTWSFQAEDVPGKLGHVGHPACKAGLDGAGSSASLSWEIVLPRQLPGASLEMQLCHPVMCTWV